MLLERVWSPHPAAEIAQHTEHNARRPLDRIFCHDHSGSMAFSRSYCLDSVTRQLSHAVRHLPQVVTVNGTSEWQYRADRLKLRRRSQERYLSINATVYYRSFEFLS